MGSEIYLIDGSAFIYRAFHAVAPLSNSQGMQTNAVFGFASMVRRLLKERQPAYLAVAFDSRGPVFRHEIYAQYKANRPAMPEELAVQLPYIKRLVEALGIVSLEESGIEADDIIGSLASRLSAQGHQVVIVSGDKDLLQLVDDNVRMWDPMSDKLMDSEAVQKKYQVPPAVLLECFALIGDSSDNIPGVPGVGPKTAAKLIDQFGSLERLYEELDSLKPSKMKENLIAHRDSAFLARSLIELKLDAVVETDKAAYQLQEIDEPKLKELYSELGFASLLKELQSAQAIPMEGFKLVNNDSALAELKEELAAADILVIDTETTSLNTRKADLVGISLSTKVERCWYLPIAHLHEDGTLLEGQLSLEEIERTLEPYLTDPSLPKLGHNVKYDYAVLRRCLGVKMAGPLLDTMIAAYLVEPTNRSFKLDDLCLDLDLKLTSYNEITRGDKRGNGFAYVELKQACRYSCEDVFGTLKLWEYYVPRLEENGQYSLFQEVEMPLVPILDEMESAGIRVKPDRLETLAEQFSEKLGLLETEIFALAGHSFNINSPQQLGAVLFDELELPHGRKTKTGYSTDMKVLEKLASKHELPALIIEYRNLVKLLNTYVEKLSQLIDEQTGRVHTSFNQTITSTGRLSSSNPNLQNIPIRGEEGGKIRHAFVPDDGKVFLFADYSQIDLRVLAHYSQDEALLAAFRGGDDIHTRTAAEIFAVSPLLVTADMRRVAKSINFGIVYGMSSFGLSNQLRISRKEAARFIEKYFSLYSGVKTFMNSIVDKAREDGFVSTLLNRRRYLPEINSSNKTRREFAERAAINTPIQGTAADIIKLAMLRVNDLLKNREGSCRMLLQIHDELVFEVDEGECEDIKGDICHTMEQAMVLDVPLTVNMESGSSLAK